MKYSNILDCQMTASGQNRFSYTNSMFIEFKINIPRPIDHTVSQSQYT